MIAFFRKHKVLTAIGSLMVLSAGWYLFRPEKLFINQKVNEAAPFGTNDAALPVYTGVLSGKLHDTAGRATVYRDTDGTLMLRFTNFHTSNGPDVHVVLAAAGDPALQSATPGKTLQAIEIGGLKANEGDQAYTLPAHADLARYNTVAIYCERFHA